MNIGYSGFLRETNTQIARKQALRIESCTIEYNPQMIMYHQQIESRPHLWLSELFLFSCNMSVVTEDRVS